MRWLRRLWDWLAPVQPIVVTPPRVEIELRPFSWLDDYGPHWEPGSTAFWLEPTREADLIAWLRRYRPEFVGTFEAAGLTVEVAREDWHERMLAQAQADLRRLALRREYRQRDPLLVTDAYQNMTAGQQAMFLQQARLRDLQNQPALQNRARLGTLGRYPFGGIF